MSAGKQTTTENTFPFSFVLKSVNEFQLRDPWTKCQQKRVDTKSTGHSVYTGTVQKTADVKEELHDLFISTSHGTLLTGGTCLVSVYGGLSF